MREAQFFMLKHINFAIPREWGGSRFGKRRNRGRCVRGREKRHRERDSGGEGSAMGGIKRGRRKGSIALCTDE
jgi:hypothetical protein